jgi:signal transduction histidine kinase
VQNPEDELGRMAAVFNATLARLEASFDRLRAFTANTSHELRTPLTVMRSVGEVALQGPLEPERARDVIGSMLEEVDRLTRLVECLLAVARAESGHPTHALASVDVASLAREVVDLMEILAEEKQQELTLDGPETAMAQGHVEPLRQALANLVDNAIRYTPEGGRIRIRIRSLALGLMVEVEDNGPGISAADRDRIFDRFYRAQPDPGGDSHGTGLGLAIARSAVEACGGRLACEPATKGGSLFRITLQVP